MHSIAALVMVGVSLLGQAAGVTESELPPPGSNRVIEQPARTIIPGTPAPAQPPANAAAAEIAPPAPPVRRSEEAGAASTRPVAAFWFVLQGN